MKKKLAGFKITDWVSDSMLVKAKMKFWTEGCNKEASMNMDETAMENILGMYWNVNIGEFVYKVNASRVDP